MSSHNGVLALTLKTSERKKRKDLVEVTQVVSNGHLSNGHPPVEPRIPDIESLRRCAWAIGEERAAEAFTPQVSHVGLAMVSPCEGFAHWRILQPAVEQLARERGPSWHHCRFVLRLYDVSQ